MSVKTDKKTKKQTTKTESVSAFTEEQMKILKAAFDHTSCRVLESQNDLIGTHMRLEALSELLDNKGVIDQYEVTRELHRDGFVEMDWEPEPMNVSFNEVVIQRILEGDLSASTRCFDQESKASEEKRAEVRKNWCDDCLSDYEEGHGEKFLIDDETDQEEKDICKRATEYDNGQYIYDYKNRADLTRAKARVKAVEGEEEEDEDEDEQKPNAACTCCGAVFYSARRAEWDHRFKTLTNETAQDIPLGDDAAGAPEEEA